MIILRGHRALKVSLLNCLFVISLPFDTHALLEDAPWATLQAHDQKLEKMVKEVAKSLLDQHQDEKLKLDAGRENLLHEMTNHPSQLSLDLIRRDLIKIGEFSIPNELLVKKSGEERYEEITKHLKEYVTTQRHNLLNNDVAGRLGQFFSVEILYAITQTFGATAQIEAYKEQELQNGQFGAVAGDAFIESSFRFNDSNSPILTVSTVTEKDLINLQGKTDRKKFVTDSKIFFNLKSGEVTYHHYYKIDHKEKFWTTTSQL